MIGVAKSLMYTYHESKFKCMAKMTNGYKGYKTEDKYDICPECMRKIIEFLKEEQNHE